MGGKAESQQHSTIFCLHFPLYGAVTSSAFSVPHSIYNNKKMEGFVLVPLQPHTMNKFNGMWIDLHTQQVIAHSMGLLDEQKKLVTFVTKRTGKCDCSNFNIILENSIFTVVYLWGPSLDHESQRKRAITKCHNDLRLNTRAVFAKSRACFKSSVLVHLDQVCCFHSKPFPFALHFLC